MDELIAFAARYGYGLIFAVVLLDQFGSPVPSVPLLVIAGGFIAEGEMQWFTTLAVVTAAALPGDWAWYEFGRARGPGVLRLLCRISLEPDSCVQRTRGLFARSGPFSLLVAKFFPGLDTAAPPLAGAAHMPRASFLFFAILGTWLWAGVFVALGVFLGDELHQLAEMLAPYGRLALFGFALALVVYLAAKFVQRNRVLRSLRVARIDADELFARTQDGESIAIIDLRSAIDLELDPARIPGARQLPFEEIDERHGELPRDREIVVYCT